MSEKNTSIGGRKERGALEEEDGAMEGACGLGEMMNRGEKNERMGRWCVGVWSVTECVCVAE